MKKKRTLAAGIINTVLYCFFLIASILVVGMGVVFVFGGVTIAGDNPLAALFGALGAVIGVVFAIVGVVMFVVFLLFLIFSARLIKIAKFDDDRYNRKRGGLIAYLVFIILQVLGGIVSVVQGFIVAQEPTLLVALVPVALLALSAVFIILDLSKVKRLTSVQEANLQLETPETNEDQA